MNKLLLVSALASSLILSGCGSSTSSTGNDTINGATSAISGNVTETDPVSGNDVAFPGVTVECIYLGSLPCASTATTDSSGNYSVTTFNSTDFYLRASKTGYITINSSIKQVTADDTGNDVGMVTTADANGLINMVFPSAGKTITGSAWLVVDVVNASDNPIGGVTVSPDIANLSASEYPDCAGAPTGIGATANCPTGSDAVSYMAEYNITTATEITVNVNGVPQKGFINKGEVLYMVFQQ